MLVDNAYWHQSLFELFISIHVTMLSVITWRHLCHLFFGRGKIANGILKVKFLSTLFTVPSLQ